MLNALNCKYLTSNVKVYQMKCTEKPDEMMTNFNFITGQFCKNKLIKNLICLICISILSEGRGWILGQKTSTGSEGGKYKYFKKIILYYAPCTYMEGIDYSC